MALTLSVDQSDLSINSWLIRWGLMSGEYKDGKINTTKFGLINQLFAFWLFVYAIIKWTILLFFPEDSLLANQLGEFAQWYGPKLITDVILNFTAVNSLLIILLFYFCANFNSKKMLFWLDFMEFDADNRRFKKMKLNNSD